MTLYVQREVQEAAAAEAGFRYAFEDGIGVSYWIDGRSGYALSGELDKKTLLGLATLAYHQLSES